MIICTPTRGLPSAAGGASSATKFVFSDAGGNPIVLPLPSAGQLAGATKKMAMFRIIVGGRAVGGTTTNFTPQLQYGTSATPGNNADIDTGVAVAVNSSSGIFAAEYICIVDDSSGKLDFVKWNFVGGSTRTYTTWAIPTAGTTGVDMDGNLPMGFVVAGTFSASNSGNSASLDIFVMRELA